MLLGLIALISTGLFAGAALYVTLVEHPARLECGPAAAVTVFGPSYRRGALMQATLAAVGCVAGVAAWAREGGTTALVAGLLLGAIIAFTLIAILPTNKRLLDPTLARDSAEATKLLTRWGWLHAVRTAASGFAFLLLALRVIGGF